MANLILGLQGIEVLDLSSPGKVTTVPSPSVQSCVRSPVSLAVGDVNVDGLEDILVMDPSCGNWIAIAQANGTFQSVRWSEVLPDIAPHFFFRSVEIAPRVPMVIVGSEFSASGSYRHDTGEWKSWRHPLRHVPPPWLSLTDIFAIRAKSLAGFELLFQGAGRLAVLNLRVADGELQVEATADLIEEPANGALRAHHGFDHFVGFAEDACDVVAMGIGLYPQSAGNIPRKVGVLRRNGDRFVAEELPFDCDAITFGVAIHASDVFVGTIGRCGERTTAQLGRIRDCARSVEILARRDIEFEWQRASSSPGQTASALPMTNGIDLFVEAPDANSVRLSSYDGFTLRTIWAEQGTPWSMREERVPIHVKREDVTW